MRDARQSMHPEHADPVGRGRRLATACMAALLLLPAFGANAQDAVSTSRSNKKGAAVAAPANPAARTPPVVTPADPAKATINTSRSNIKHGVAAPPVATDPAGPAQAPISTSRSNKKHGVPAATGDDPSQR